MNLVSVEQGFLEKCAELGLDGAPILKEVGGVSELIVSDSEESLLLLNSMIKKANMTPQSPTPPPTSLEPISSAVGVAEAGATGVEMASGLSSASKAARVGSVAGKIAGKLSPVGAALETAVSASQNSAKIQAERGMNFTNMKKQNIARS